MKGRMKKIILLMLALLLVSVNGYAAYDTEEYPDAEQQIIQKVNKNISKSARSVKIVEVPQEKLLQCEQLIAGFAKNGNFSYSICYNERPMFVLVGVEGSLQKIVTLLEKISGKPVHSELIYITASLQEAAIGDGSALGMHINDIPVGGWVQVTGNNKGRAAPTSAFQIGDLYRAFGNMKFRANDGDSKILVAGQVVTTNGLQGVMTSTEQVPYVTVNANGSSSVDYYTSETKVKITPTIIEYDLEKPELSKIQLDIDMQVSSINSLSTLVSTSVPEINKRRVKTMRTVNADGEENIVAAMMRDENVKVEQGVPILNQIPVLKYFFSQEVDAKTHVVSLLKLSVEFVSQEDAEDERLMNRNPLASDYQELEQ